MRTRTVFLLLLFFQGHYFLHAKNRLEAASQQLKLKVEVEAKESIGTTAEYCEFLNEEAVVDALGFYDEKMGNQTTGYRLQATGSEITTASLIRSGNPGNYHYEVMDGKENSPINYVSQNTAMCYCDWLENAASTSTSHLNGDEGACDEELRSNRSDLYSSTYSNKDFLNEKNGRKKSGKASLGIDLGAVVTLVAATLADRDASEERARPPTRSQSLTMLPKIDERGSQRRSMSALTTIQEEHARSVEAIKAPLISEEELEKKGRMLLQQRKTEESIASQGEGQGSAGRMMNNAFLESAPISAQEQEVSVKVPSTFVSRVALADEERKASVSYQTELLDKKRRDVEHCFQVADSAHAWHRISNDRAASLVFHKRFYAHEEKARERYAAIAIQDAIKAARDQIPGAARALEVRLTQAAAEASIKHRAAMTPLGLQSAEAWREAMRYAAIRDADRIALEAFKEEAARIVENKTRTVASHYVTERAAQAKRESAAKSYGEGVKEPWLALTPQEREAYNNSIQAENQLRAAATAKLLERITEQAHSMRERILNWKVWWPTKRAAHEALSRVEEDLARITMEETARKKAIQWALLTFEEREAREEERVYHQLRSFEEQAQMSRKQAEIAREKLQAARVKLQDFSKKNYPTFTIRNEIYWREKIAIASQNICASWVKAMKARTTTGDETLVDYWSRSAEVWQNATEKLIEAMQIDVAEEMSGDWHWQEDVATATEAAALDAMISARYYAKLQQASAAEDESSVNVFTECLQVSQRAYEQRLRAAQAYAIKNRSEGDYWKKISSSTERAAAMLTQQVKLGSSQFSREKLK